MGFMDSKKNKILGKVKERLFNDMQTMNTSNQHNTISATKLNYCNTEEFAADLLQKKQTIKEKKLQCYQQYCHLEQLKNIITQYRLLFTKNGGLLNKIQLLLGFYYYETERITFQNLDNRKKYIQNILNQLLEQIKTLYTPFQLDIISETQYYFNAQIEDTFFPDYELNPHFLSDILTQLDELKKQRTKKQMETYLDDIYTELIKENLLQNQIQTLSSLIKPLKNIQTRTDLNDLVDDFKKNLKELWQKEFYYFLKNINEKSELLSNRLNEIFFQLSRDLEETKKELQALFYYKCWAELKETNLLELLEDYTNNHIKMNTVDDYKNLLQQLCSDIEKIFAIADIYFYQYETVSEKKQKEMFYTFETAQCLPAVLYKENNSEKLLLHGRAIYKPLEHDLQTD